MSPTAWLAYRVTRGPTWYPNAWTDSRVVHAVLHAVGFRDGAGATKPGPAIVNLVFVLVTELRCVVEVS